MRDFIVNINGVDKAELLAALYNNSDACGLGLFGTPMTKEAAQKELQKSTWFDYLNARLLKVNLKGDELNASDYDSAHGQGTVARIVEQIRAGIKIAPKETLLEKYIKAQSHPNPVLIGGLHRADVLHALYNNATGYEGSIAMAHEIIDESAKSNNYAYVSIDLGCGPCQLEVDLSDPEFDPTAYDKRYGFMAAQKTVEKLRQALLEKHNATNALRLDNLNRFRFFDASKSYAYQPANNDEMEVKVDKPLR